ncbi:hypothetical protein B0A48_05806 [Cryoendolithus antarcticus]|uniref:ATP-grasp domain-containing protein n=1 Tax=Cryoendolithus antarcticus TaxID=1507870 RepID=A0A1V8TC06_9PEZI|nr:hypothetical protein B0A48_05806 [Cryoendolithus antarcticus]
MSTKSTSIDDTNDLPLRSAGAMLDANSSWRAHAAQNLALLSLSVMVLPFTTSLLLLSYAVNLLYTAWPLKLRASIRSPQTPIFPPKKILVTGVGMTKGLALARLFFAAGHEVIGADFEPSLIPTACGHMSKAIKSFYKLTKPGPEGGAKYTKSILDIVVMEDVDLWVSCSGVASAVEDGEAKELIELVTNCKAVQFDVATTKRLHEKHLFMEYTRSIGLPTPESHTITSRAAALQLLIEGGAKGTAKGKKDIGSTEYIMKYVGTDDAVRGDMTLLPLDTPAATKAHIGRLPISEDRPWILQQYIKGPEYCTHSLVVRGEVKAFVACPSAELLMHYSALPSESALSQSMLRFTQEYAAAGGESFTGHLSFDFLVDEAEAEAAARDPTKHVHLHPIECNPRAHTAVALLNDTPAMAEAYMTLLQPSTSVKRLGVDEKVMANGLAPQPIFPVTPTKQYNWVGHDLFEFIILPVFALLFSNTTNVSKVLDGILEFAEHLLFWHDGTFEIWDPLPAWWLYHVYWPTQFLLCLVYGKKWSRINVSTCKIFMC